MAEPPASSRLHEDDLAVALEDDSVPLWLRIDDACHMYPWVLTPSDLPKSVTVPAPGALPCPFCGSANVHNWASDDHGPGCWSMMCFGCECEGPHTNSEAESVRLWNMRAPL